MLKVKSGKCFLCDTGRETTAVSTWGDTVKLHTGDIVIVWHGAYLDTDIENWTPCGMSVVVCNQYTTYTDGRTIETEEEFEPYVMGIKDCGFTNNEWRIQVIKKFSDCIEGEHWPNYGFSYFK